MTNPLSPRLKEALSALAQGRLEDALPGLQQEADEGIPEACFTLGTLYANGEGVPLDYTRAAKLIGTAAERNLAAAQPVLAWMYAHGYGVPLDNEKARGWYLKAAEGGDADAQLSAAMMFHFGRFGADRDMSAALHWYSAAANQGHAKAQFALGKLMAEGKLVEPNDEAAFQWLTLAIMHGSEPAKKELAMLTGRLKPETVERYKQHMMEHMAADEAPPRE